MQSEVESAAEVKYDNTLASEYNFCLLFKNYNILNYNTYLQLLYKFYLLNIYQYI